MIDFNEITDGWVLCSGYDCERKGTCLRHQAFRQAPKRVTQWTCVLPTALADGVCGYYKKAEKARMARGFQTLFQQLRSRDARHDIRMALTNYFGSKGSYYRYRDGERMMSPERQEAVAQIFRKYGFEGEITFDTVEECYDFT